MTLLLIAIAGAIAGVGIVVMLECGWRRTGERATHAPDPFEMAEELERDATASLLAGRITAEQYRATVTALACGSIAAINQPRR